MENKPVKMVVKADGTLTGMADAEDLEEVAGGTWKLAEVNKCGELETHNVNWVGKGNHVVVTAEEGDKFTFRADARICSCSGPRRPVAK